MGYEKALVVRLLEKNPDLEDLADVIDAVDNHRYAPDLRSP